MAIMTSILSAENAGDNRDIDKMNAKISQLIFGNEKADNDFKKCFLKSHKFAILSTQVLLHILKKLCLINHSKKE